MEKGRPTRMTLTLATVCVLVCCISPTVTATVNEDVVNCEPRFVHLSIGEAADQVSIVWATNGTCSDTQVAYGTSQWRLEHKVTGESQPFTSHNLHGLQQLHKVTLTGLQEKTTYFYRPLSNQMSSGPFYFQSLSPGLDWSPNVMVVGELGAHWDLLLALSEMTLTGQYNAALQLGTLSPYFSDENGMTGDQLMQGIEQMAAYMPLMTAPGLYERPEDPFASYRHRFSMPGSLWPIPDDTLWYSFNLGPVHFVSYCTDIYLHGNKSLEQKQYQWLAKDLIEANRVRDKWPWIVAFGHHPLYCSDTPHHPDCAKNVSLVRAGLEETLYYYGVDLILQSHTSGYERMYPTFKGVVLSNNYTNPRAPVQIISGTATATNVANTPATPVQSANGTKANGNNSDSSNNNKTASVDKENKDNRPTDSLSMVAFKMPANSTELTYGRLHVINATHVHWELLSGRVGKEGKGAEVLDSVWIVQEQHGKFQITDLPHEVEEKIDQNLVAEGGRPGVLDVQDADTNSDNQGKGGNSTANRILTAASSHRVVLGISLGVVVLVIVIIVVICKLRHKRNNRRVARRWDSMDYKYGKTKLYTPTSGDDDEDDDDFRDDNDFEITTPDSRLQTKKLINGK